MYAIFFYGFSTTTLINNKPAALDIIKHYVLLRIIVSVTET